MKILKTDIPGVLQISPSVFCDDRGFFLETYEKKKYRSAGIKYQFVQDNYSRSKKNVVRGLHYQHTHMQGKLVRVVYGEAFDVAVDVRIGSPTFGKYTCVTLSAKSKNQLWIPPGFAHGYCAITEYADFEYKCTDFYYPQEEISIIWNDPDINIPWPTSLPILSEKDEIGSNLKKIPTHLLPKYEVGS